MIVLALENPGRGHMCILRPDKDPVSENRRVSLAELVEQFYGFVPVACDALLLCDVTNLMLCMCRLAHCQRLCIHSARLMYACILVYILSAVQTWLSVR